MHAVSKSGTLARLLVIRTTYQICCAVLQINPMLCKIESFALLAIVCRD